MLGITYREGTAVTEASQPFAIATTLLRQGYEVVVCDPAVSKKTCAEWGFDVVANPAECVERADGVVLAQCGDLWRLVPEAVWSARRPIVFDCWRQLPTSLVEKLAGNYLALGRTLPMPNAVRLDPGAIRFDPFEIPDAPAADHEPARTDPQSYFALAGAGQANRRGRPSPE